MFVGYSILTPLVNFTPSPDFLGAVSTLLTSLMWSSVNRSPRLTLFKISSLDKFIF